MSARFDRFNRLPLALLLSLLPAWASAVPDHSIDRGQGMPQGTPLNQPLDEQALADLRSQVRATECAFAASMAQRDLAAFERHLSADTIFFNGSQVLRGPRAVVAGWRAYFEGAQAPFSWAPDQVEVIGDGSLAQSTGLVRNAKGELTGRFVSVWRQEAPGRWRIVIDRGVPLSTAERQAPPAAASGCEA